MFEKIIVKVARALTKRNISYMLIGGQAVLLYGTPRLTKDIDITLGVSIDRLPDIVNAADAAKLSVIPDNYKIFTAKTMVLPVKDKKTGIRVDFIFSFTPYEKQAIKRAKKVNIGGMSVNYASPEDVIIHKLFAGRARDIEDVESIMIKTRRLKIAYIKQWLTEFDISSADSPGLIKTFEQLLMKNKKVIARGKGPRV